ncbi:MAG: ribosomal RNA small subunit methyltransferase A [Planctomycetes bacterium]|nr:ribosomal RNA small subunit methyltransferase A [Planctomycetota bacterium]
MQTKTQIQELLEAAGVKPNKRLGQNFLIDLNLMRLLLDSAQIGKNDIVLEIGCGTGSLTEALSEKAGQVISVEIDSTLAEITKNQLAQAENVQVLQTDALKNKNNLNPVVTGAIEKARNKFSGKLLLVANLPYSVACPVMLNLIKSEITADEMYVTIQKEVAERMTAKPDNKHYGTLSIYLAATGETKIIRVLKPKVFWPQPQVASAIVSFVRKKEKTDKIKNMELFGEIVSFLMCHRRKTLSGCVKLATGKLENNKKWLEIFESCSINPKARPEKLSPEDYIAIANMFDQYPS